MVLPFRGAGDLLRGTGGSHLGTSGSFHGVRTCAAEQAVQTLERVTRSAEQVAQTSAQVAHTAAQVAHTAAQVLTSRRRWLAPRSGWLQSSLESSGEPIFSSSTTIHLRRGNNICIIMSQSRLSWMVSRDLTPVSRSSSGRPLARELFDTTKDRGAPSRPGISPRPAQNPGAGLGRPGPSALPMAWAAQESAQLSGPLGSRLCTSQGQMLPASAPMVQCRQKNHGTA